MPSRWLDRRCLAGLMTKSGTVAFIGAMELDTTLGKYNGFKEAAAYVGQQEGKTVSTLDVVYSGDFSAADKGIEFAKAMIDQALMCSLATPPLWTPAHGRPLTKPMPPAAP